MFRFKKTYPLVRNKFLDPPFGYNSFSYYSSLAILFVVFVTLVNPYTETKQQELCKIRIGGWEVCWGVGVLGGGGVT